MRTRFDVVKTTEAAAHLMKLHGGSMSILKLIKLLYIADRNAIKDQGKSITGDRYFSLDYGPVLSATKNLIDQTWNNDEAAYWRRHISQRDNNRVSLQVEPGADEKALSIAEKELLDSTYQFFGGMDRFELADYTHSFGEWKDPRGSALPIRMREILEALELSEEEIEDRQDEEEAVEALRVMFG